MLRGLKAVMDKTRVSFFTKAQEGFFLTGTFGPFVARSDGTMSLNGMWLESFLHFFHWDRCWSRKYSHSFDIHSFLSWWALVHGPLAYTRLLAGETVLLLYPSHVSGLLVSGEYAWWLYTTWWWLLCVGWWPGAFSDVDGGLLTFPLAAVPGLVVGPAPAAPLGLCQRRWEARLAGQLNTLPHSGHLYSRWMILGHLCWASAKASSYHDWNASKTTTDV